MTFDTGDTMYHLGICKANPNVLTGGSPGRIRRVAEYLSDAEVIESDRGLVTVHGMYHGVPITAFSSGMGPASVSITLPEIIEACDDDKMSVIRIGTSGALQSRLNIGDFVVTTTVDRYETTSDKVMGDGYVAKADEEVALLLENISKEKKLPFQSVYRGPTRVVNEIYCNNASVQGKEDPDVLAVSMEFSVIVAFRDWYNANDGRNIKAGNLLIVSDNLAAHGEGTVDMTEFLARKKEIERIHIHSGLQALYKLAKKVN